jgi:hypothetical protein
VEGLEEGVCVRIGDVGLEAGVAGRVVEAGRSQGSDQVRVSADLYVVVRMERERKLN